MPPRGTRPTADRVRESLFNVLAARLDFPGMSVLDLYAGSGALGLEALSRGAATATFVESDAAAAAVISRNIATVGMPGATLRRGTVRALLAAGTAGPADLVLADPPYDVSADEVSAVLTALHDGGWVHAGTVVVVERAKAGQRLTWPEGWTAWRERRYGDSRLEMAEVDTVG